MARHDMAKHVIAGGFSGRGAVTRDGFGALGEYLKKVEEKLPGACRRALESGATIVQEGVRSRINPAGESTGNLRNSIGYRVDRDNRWVNIGWEDRRRGFGLNTSAMTYGPILEFSTDRVLRHLYDGFDDTRDKALSSMHDELEQAFK